MVSLQYVPTQQNIHLNGIVKRFEDTDILGAKLQIHRAFHSEKNTIVLHVRIGF